MELTLDEYKCLLLRFLKEKRLLHDIDYELKRDYQTRIMTLSEIIDFVYAERNGKGFLKLAVNWYCSKKGYTFYQDLYFELEDYIFRVNYYKKICQNIKKSQSDV